MSHMKLETAVAGIRAIDRTGTQAHNLGDLALAAAVAAGLPLSALNRVAASIAPGDPSFVYRLVPRATLSRRRAVAGGMGRLSAETSAKIARLNEIWTFAIEVWGDADAARAFLLRPHPMLQDRAPLDVILMNEFGGEAVRGNLGRLQYGSAA